MATRPALDPATVAERTGSGYPPPYDMVCAGRGKRALGNELGLTHFGVNLTRVDPGAASALRHWHTREDEFVYVLEGELTLVTDAGEQTLGPGMAAGFPAGVSNGHQLVNRTIRPALYLEVGDRPDGDEVRYPDVDLFIGPDFVFRHKSGEPY
jgi:uncharacterized cupin superfamily protein